MKWVGEGRTGDSGYGYGSSEAGKGIVKDDLEDVEVGSGPTWISEARASPWA